LIFSNLTRLLYYCQSVIIPSIFLVLKKPVSFTDTGFYIATQSCISSGWS